MPVVMDAVKADCTLGEISDVFREAFGVYRDPAWLWPKREMAPGTLRRKRVDVFCSCRESTSTRFFSEPIGICLSPMVERPLRGRSSQKRLNRLSMNALVDRVPPIMHWST